MSFLTRSAGSDFGPISMIHFRRPSSSQVPPQMSHTSTGTLKYRPGDVAPPQPEQNIPSLSSPSSYTTKHPVLQAFSRNDISATLPLGDGGFAGGSAREPPVLPGQARP